MRPAGRTGWTIACTILLAYACTNADPGADLQDLADVQEDSETLVVGTFDSRCVALAYYRSEPVLEELEVIHTEYGEALASGDSARAAELEELGPARQSMMHGQVFGTDPVDEILWTVWTDLQAIAERSGVDMLVSEWALVYRSGDFRSVDLTDRIADLFDPSEETLEIISQMKGMPAIPSQLIPPDA